MITKMGLAFQGVWVGLYLLSYGNALIPSLSSRKTRAQVAVSVVGNVDDATQARSAFGTKTYWDEVYEGRGDFPADEYSWYYGWDTLKPYVTSHVPKSAKILLPGVGNDPVLLDLVKAGYRFLTAQDYSSYAIDRQKDLLSYEDTQATIQVQLSIGDVRKLPQDWNGAYDAVLEKGLLDAVYLSGDGNLEQAVESLTRVLRPGGILISVSGVVPEDLRRIAFGAGWEWLRDGGADLQAGCFVFRKTI